MSSKKVSDLIKVAEKTILPKNKEAYTAENKIVELRNNLDKITQNSIIFPDIIPVELEKIEDEIRNLLTNQAKCSWYIGERLNYIFTNEQYKVRNCSFEEYCKDIYGISRVSAWRMIWMYKNFSNVSALKHGSKLYLLQTIKDLGERNKVLEWMEEENPTYREVESKINENRKLLEPLPNNQAIRSDKIIHQSKNKITIDKSKLTKDKIEEINKKLEKLCEKRNEDVILEETHQNSFDIRKIEKSNLLISEIINEEILLDMKSLNEENSIILIFKNNRSYNNVVTKLIELID